MILGTVNARNEALVQLRLRGPSGIETAIETIVDSGFTAALTLPMANVTALNLTRNSGSEAVMADGSVRQFDIYAAEVWWGNGWQSVMVSAVGYESLLGMRLLAGHQLRVDVIAGGVVEITPLS